MYGDITESKAAEIVSGLLYLESQVSQSRMIASELEASSMELPEHEKNLAQKGIKLYISTHGGSASDMFSILDVISMIQKSTCNVETIGIGKVMSAGVLILSAGTKGKRKIGKNCRVMLHNVVAGSMGTIANMENEIEEVKWVQERYIECLARNTKLTKSKIKKLLKFQKDVYISSDDAIKYGIADEII